MAKSKFQVDPTNLDKAAADALSAHTAGRMSYAEWKQHASLIQKLRGIEGFRKQHKDALYNSSHPKHTTRTAEFQDLYEGAYPGDPAGTPAA